MSIADNYGSARLMYNRGSETGRKKLQSVKENLYEAATKLVLYSIEMYTKKPLREWVKTDLIEKIEQDEKMDYSIKQHREEFEQGNIGKMDSTNGIYVINRFVRAAALKQAQEVLQAKIKFQVDRKAFLQEKEDALQNRIQELLTQPNADNHMEAESEKSFEPFQYEDDVEEFSGDELSEIEKFKKDLCIIDDIEELNKQAEKLNQEIESLNKLLFELDVIKGSPKGNPKENKKWSKKGNPKESTLEDQQSEEFRALNTLRDERNVKYGHDTRDNKDVTDVGKWEPEAGPLYEWASNILRYIKVIEARYRMYSLFDDFYAEKEYKDKFESCKVYVQRQINELYVNHSGTVLEFAGDLYEKDDEERNFRSLIQAMARNWDTGIRYLTVVTNDDMPEFNAFFKECLSGTSMYVDYYLVDRNELRAAYRKKGGSNTDYLYFQLLYHLQPSMKQIYWKGKTYRKDEFAQLVLYKALKVNNMFQFDKRLENPEQYFDGIDLRKWCENHLLSDAYFSGKDDERGRRLASKAEDAIMAFCDEKALDGQVTEAMYKKAIYALAKLYFYMRGERVFSYTRKNKKTLHWHSLEEARVYVENASNFDSFEDLYQFETDVFNSSFYSAWYREMTFYAEKR